MLSASSRSIVPHGPIQLKLDRKFLADTPDSAFPIVFDPTVQLGSGNMQNYKVYPQGSASCLSACQLRVGNTREPYNGAVTDVYWRSVGYFDYTAAFGAQVSDVWLDLSRNPTEGSASAYTNNVNINLPNAYNWPGAVGGNMLLAQGTVGDNTGNQPVRGAALTNQIATWARLRQAGGALGFTGLEQPGLYTYKKFDIFNLNVTYAATPPGTPTSLSATAQRDGSAVLSFPAAAPDGGGGQVRYEVKAFNGSGQVGGTFNTTSTNPVTWNGLVDGVSYTFTVQAFNSAGGSGVRTSPQVAATRYAAAPANVLAWPGNGNVWVTWDAADARGGPAVTGYNVFLCKPDGSVCYGPTGVTGNFGRAKVNPAGTANGTAYVAVVRAVTGRGDGDNGVSGTVVPSATAAPFPVQYQSASAGAGARTWVTWTPPVDNGAGPVTSYIIWRLVSGVYTQYWTGIPGSPPAGGTVGTFEATNLADTRPSTYLVYPVNANSYVGAPGPGPATTTVTPAANAAPYSPQRPSGSTAPVNQPSLDTGDGQIMVRWSPPAPNGATGGCSTPNSYAVYLYDGTAPFLTQTVTGTSATFTPIPAGPGQPGVINGHTYIGIVYALNTTGGCANSGYSGPAYTPYGTPMSGLGDLITPTQVAASRGDQKASVTWKKPVLGLDGLTTYTITATPGPAGTPANPTPAVGATTITTEAMSGGPTLTHDIGGLRNGTTYTITVTANLLSLLGTPPSTPSNPVVPAGKPFAPVISTATGGDQQATVNWLAPPDHPDGVPGNNGRPITGYTITSSSGDTVSALPDATSATVHGLTNGNAYTFTVQATNIVGTGLASGPSQEVTPAGPPFAPSYISASLVGDTSATVSWVAPGTNRAPITGYTVLLTPACPGCSNTTTTGATSTTINGLQPGTPYSVTVTATNRAGTSAPGPVPARVTTPAAPTAPDAPVIESVSVHDGYVVLTWTQPNSNRSAIIDYTVTSDPSFGTPIVTSANTITINPLANGTAYTFAVVARNGIGTSSPGYSGPATPGQAPPGPASVTTTPGDASFTLTWSPGPGSDGTLVTYSVTTSDANGLMSPQPPTTITGTTATVTGLNGATQYYFGVTATNNLGQSGTTFTRTVVTYSKAQADSWMTEDLGAFQTLRGQAPAPYDWNSNGCNVIKYGDPDGLIFEIACYRHDFGYRNYGSGIKLRSDEAERAIIDAQFRTDMYRLCDDHPQYGLDCRQRADVIYGFVRGGGARFFY